MPLTPFEAAEIAFEKAVASEKVAKTQRMESILGGKGERTAGVAFEVWQSEMADLGFAEYAHEPESDE